MGVGCYEIRVNTFPLTNSQPFPKIGMKRARDGMGINSLYKPLFPVRPLWTLMDTEDSAKLCVHRCCAVCHGGKGVEGNCAFSGGLGVICAFDDAGVGSRL